MVFAIEPSFLLEGGLLAWPPSSNTMNKIDKDKLWEYLADMGMIDLLELWEQLGGIFDASESGVADYIVESYYPEEIIKLLTVDIIPDLVSDKEFERKEAQEKMEQMGVT